MVAAFTVTTLLMVYTMPLPSKALSNLRVLDLTRVRAGPTCVRILANFSAAMAGPAAGNPAVTSES